MNSYIKNIFLLLAVVILPVTAQGQDNTAYRGEIIYRDAVAERLNDFLTIRFQIDISYIELSSQRVIQLTPILRNGDLGENRFDPIYITGKTREKVISRKGYDLMANQSAGYVIRKNNKEQVIPVTLTVPFADWMYNSDLYFDEKINGCAECELGENRYLIVNQIVPEKFVPSYQLQYVTPEVEEIKERSDTYTAHLNFRVGKSDVVRDFENNSTVLDSVDLIVREIRNDKNLNVRKMSVTGYASPEGNHNGNLILSKERSQSFVRYLIQAHDIDASLIKTDWKGEDWERLRKDVANSTLPDKDMVIRIIDNYPNINQRKQQLHTLNGGTTYRILLNDYYPPLRRIDYVFDYIARSFDVEEAKEVIKTKPQHLSLNEMYHVAQTYEKGSKEFDEIFDIAVRLFPENEDANLNAAVQEINMGATDRAIRRLKKIERPEAWNNLGVAYVNKEEYNLALECFTKASDAGNKVAKANQEQLKKFLEEM